MITPTLYYFPGGPSYPRGSEVKVGDEVVLTHNEPEGGRRMTITGIELPRHPASTGRVYLRPKDGKDAWGDESYFPSVIDAYWVGRTDQEPLTNTPHPITIKDWEN